MRTIWLQWLAVAVWLAQASARGQEPANPARDPSVTPAHSPSSLGDHRFPVDGRRRVAADEVSPSPPTSEPNPFPSAAPADSRLFQDVKFFYTFLPGDGASGFGNDDIEVSVTRAIPWDRFSEAPLLVTPGFGFHAWEGPRSGRFGMGPDLPPRVYDAYLDLGWKPRLREWLFADLGVAPGVYSDFESSGGDPFRLRGSALGFVAFSERVRLMGASST